MQSELGRCKVRVFSGTYFGHANNAKTAFKGREFKRAEAAV